MEANSTGGQGLRRAVTPSDDDDNDGDDDDVCTKILSNAYTTHSSF